MAYSASGLSIGWQLIGGKYRLFVYRSTDTFIGTVDQTDYFTAASATLGGSPGLREGDWVLCIKTDDDPPSSVMTYVSAIDSDGNATVSAVAYAGAASFTTLDVDGNATIGDAAADTLGFHGAAGVSQPASSVQATSNIASSSDFGATQLAVVQAIMECLRTHGLWKGSA